MQRLCTRGVLRTSASSHYVYRRATLNWKLPRRIGDRRYPYFRRPDPGTSSPPDMTMPIARPELDLDSIEKLREEELDEARAIQSGMLPTQPLRVGGITISHEFQPATLVGGDYLDYFSLPGGMMGMYVGDVSGKGRPGHVCGAGGSNTQGHPQYRTASNKRLLLRGNPSRYTAIQPCSTPSQRSCIVRAPGMPGRMLLQAGECRVLKVAGIPPGLFPESTMST